MKKKLSAKLTVVATACMMAVSFAFAGCSGNAKPDFEMPENGFDPDTPVTITFYHSMGAKLRGVLDDYIEEFNKLYPNITIDHKSQGDYDGVRDVISNQIIAGNQPNLAYCYPDHVALYNRSSAVLSLNDFLPGGAYANVTVKQAAVDENGEETTVEVPLGLTQEEKDMINPNYYAEGLKFDDGSKMYSLPWIKSTEVMYYNADFFEANKLKVPETWDELEYVCEQIKKINKDAYPFTYDSEANWFITMCEQYGSPYTSSAGGEKYLFDNQTNREFVQRFADWYQKGYFTTQALNGNTYTSGLFTEESAYMCIGSSGGASYQTDTGSDLGAPFTVGIAQIPQIHPEDPKVISQGPSVCIFKNEDPQKVLASWLFLKFFITNVNFQAEFSSVSGYMPVLTPEVMEKNETYQAFLAKAGDPNYLTALSVKVGMQHANSYFVSPAFVGSSEARTQVGALMSSVFSNPQGLDAAFKYAIDQCEYYFG